MNKFLIGADPELFLADGAGALVSVIEKIGGTKTDPLALPIGEGFAVQEDNVAVEFNIPPADSEDTFQENISKAMSFLSDFFHRQHGLHFTPISAASFPKEQLNHPKAFEFGCDPDYCAWTRKENPRPKVDDPCLRSAGGHVHIGFKGTKQDKINLIKCLDLYSGVASVLMDSGELRKQLYGKAGAMRFKNYGVEYRTLSNFWVFKPELVKWVWRQTNRAMDALPNIEQINADSDFIIGAINNNDVSLANHLVDKYELEILYA